jgi:hypothetical protein
VPGIGGTLYVGDFFIVKTTYVNNITELKVKWFMTGDSIRDYAGGGKNDEEDMWYIAVKTNIYQQVSTSDIYMPIISINSWYIKRAFLIHL